MIPRCQAQMGWTCDMKNQIDAWIALREEAIKGEAPCDDCELRESCKYYEVSCAEFNQWVRSPQDWKKPDGSTLYRRPNKAHYLNLFNPRGLKSADSVIK